MADLRKAPFRFWSFFFSLQGRVSRGPFLAFELITRLSSLAGYRGLRVLHGVTPMMIGLYSLPLTLVTLTVVWPNFALLFKRFHDANLSGLWALFYFAPLLYGGYVGFAIAQAGMHHQAFAPGPQYVRWLLITVNYGLVLVAVALPAAKTTNRFGPRPGHLPDQAQDVF